MWNSGYQLAFASWALTALCVALVGLRWYTRVCIVKFVGAEDYMYASTGLFFLLYTLFLQISVSHGLGQNFFVLSAEASSQAIFWTYVANTFAILGNAMAKLSMGLFLLRVVQVPWHKAALWLACIATAVTSIILATLLWNQTTPRRLSWDPLRTQGTWHLSIQPLSVGLGVWSSIVDFFFAIFPWLFIWKLSMSKREKLLLGSGMSLGVVAGVCGIIRTVVLSQLNVLDYTQTFVKYFAWAGAEIAVAMVCIGIPTLRPLYIHLRGSADSRNLGGDDTELPQYTSASKRHSDISDLKDHIRPPPPTYSSHGRRDSVEDLISGYQDRNKAVIWVEKSVRVRESVAEWPLKN
ncbi:hypothetical protein GGR57DRAFT_299565 [Xylariaceae sp. FL1272]|nr:hypothetical protein GGR57DRAFT_299565 [Xylariaceae sp. FL1272]